MDKKTVGSFAEKLGEKPLGYNVKNEKFPENTVVRLIRLKTCFSGSHKIEGGDKIGKYTHSHDWQVETCFRILSPDVRVDRNRLKKVVKSLLPDKRDLNEVFEFNPTAENLVQELFNELYQVVMEQMYGIEPVRMVLWEKPDEGVEAGYY